MIHESFAALIRELIRQARARGIRVRITSAYRSTAAQRRLIDRYRAGDPSIHRPAAPGRSYHNYGLAVDLETAPAAALRTVGEMAERLGLRWGGRFRDPVHFDAGNLISIDEARRAFTPGRLIAL